MNRFKKNYINNVLQHDYTLEQLIQEGFDGQRKILDPAECTAVYRAFRQAGYRYLSNQNFWRQHHDLLTHYPDRQTAVQQDPLFKTATFAHFKKGKYHLVDPQGYYQDDFTRGVQHTVVAQIMHYL